jgi:hypothetical protein
MFRALLFSCCSDQHFPSRIDVPASFEMASRRVEKIAEWSLFLQVVQNRA